jgi:hypothetical protein
VGLRARRQPPNASSSTAPPAQRTPHLGAAPPAAGMLSQCSGWPASEPTRFDGDAVAYFLGRPDPHLHLRHRSTMGRAASPNSISDRQVAEGGSQSRYFATCSHDF